MSRFDSKPVNDEQQFAISELRNQYKQLEVVIDAYCPPGRYKSLALTALEQAAIWSNKAITHEWDGREPGEDG